MQNLNEYLAVDGWKRDWKNTKELYQDGLVSRIKSAIQTYDREMCNDNPNYKIPTMVVCCGTLLLGILPNEHQPIIDVSLDGYALATSAAIMLYMATNVLRNPSDFNFP